MLDPLGLMAINRMTSSLQMKTPIVEHITPEDDKKTTEQQRQDKEADLFEISLTNVINNASWSMSDVIMATPVTLAHVLQRRDKFSPFDMNPRVVVLDECDQAYESENDTTKKSLLFILRKFFGQDSGDAEYSAFNRKRQLIFTGAHISDRVKAELTSQFPTLEIV